MPLDTKHSILDQNDLLAPGGALTDTSSNESTSPAGNPSPLEPQATILLSETRNHIETVHREARDETIVNGKYILDGEDDTYYYCYHQTTYRVKVMKDSAKKNENNRDSQGRLLPGYSLVKASAAKNLTNTVKTRKKKFTQRSAEQYLEKELLPTLLELLESDTLSDQDKMKGMLAMMSFAKPTLSKVTTGKVIRVVGDDFEDAQVV